MNRLELYFRSRINKSGMIPKFSTAESMDGGAKLGMGRMKSSVLAMLTKHPLGGNSD